MARLTHAQKTAAAKLGVVVPPRRKLGRPYIVIDDASVERIMEMEALNFSVNCILLEVKYPKEVVRDLRRDPDYQAGMVAKRKLIEDFAASLRKYS